MILEAYSGTSDGDSVRSLREYLHARLPTPLRNELRTLILDRVKRHSYSSEYAYIRLYLFPLALECRKFYRILLCDGSRYNFMNREPV